MVRHNTAHSDSGLDTCRNLGTSALHQTACEISGLKTDCVKSASTSTEHSEWFRATPHGLLSGHRLLSVTWVWQSGPSLRSWPEAVATPIDQLRNHGKAVSLSWVVFTNFYAPCDCTFEMRISLGEPIWYFSDSIEPNI
jgi:hypothetical protein